MSEDLPQEGDAGLRRVHEEGVGKFLLLLEEALDEGLSRAIDSQLLDAVGDERLGVLDEGAAATLAVVVARRTLARAREGLDCRETLHTVLRAESAVLVLVAVDGVERDQRRETLRGSRELRSEVLAVSAPGCQLYPWCSN